MCLFPTWKVALTDGMRVTLTTTEETSLFARRLGTNSISDINCLCRGTTEKNNNGENVVFFGSFTVVFPALRSVYKQTKNPSSSWYERKSLVDSFQLCILGKWVFEYWVSTLKVLKLFHTVFFFNVLKENSCYKIMQL